ncbi:MAG TPA: restriction endonuclease subunit M/S [Crocinitomicaceae bacterium]|nr:restriction endonuclease subunit M/S [Crocinitomicaceae bacterium]
MTLQREKFFKVKEKVLGQFFTPPEVAEFIVSFALVHLDKAERAIDPACGEGVFLSALLKHGFKEVWGVDIDPNVLNRMSESIKERAKIIIGDALIRSPTLSQVFVLPENYFDLAVGNPPFSAKYGRISDYRLKQYKISKNKRSEAIEVLFLERFISLVRPGGVVGIIIPDGILINKNYEYVRKFILNFNIIAIISLPRGLFNSNLRVTSKTSILFLKKERNKGNDVFMFEISSIDDLPKVIEAYEMKEGLWVKPNSDCLHPKCWKKPNIQFKSGLEVQPLEKLIIEMKTGRTEYGSKRRFTNKGLRFISAKVVTPYGLDFKRDEKFVEPNSLMDKKSAHVKPDDVLFVRVGVGCAGRTVVVVDENDTGVADDWIYIIRVDKNKILPHYLAIFLQTRFGKEQLESIKRGVGTVTIPQFKLKKVLIPIPPKDFQEKIRELYIRMVSLTRAGEYDTAKELFEKMKRMVEDFLAQD